MIVIIFDDNLFKFNFKILTGELPKIDLKILRSLENQVKQLAQNINHMLNHISESSQTVWVWICYIYCYWNFLIFNVNVFI